MTDNYGIASVSPADATALPPAAYTDPAVFAWERDAIFARQWLAVARSNTMAAGSYRALAIAGDPVVVTRDDLGELHAFANVCLHRACPIAAGHGPAEHGVLTCPYHRWTYRLDGQLRAAPHMEQAAGFDLASHRLPALRVEEWMGWIFVNGDADAAPLAGALNALQPYVARARLDNMVVAHTLEFESPWNWKIMVDNFMESYHHLGAHAHTLNPVYPAGGTHWVDLPGEFALLKNPPRDPNGHVLWVACVFPSMLIAWVEDTLSSAYWYDMEIHSHDRFTLRIHVMVEPHVAADADTVNAHVQSATAVHLEDIAMCEGVWRGVSSRYARAGRLSHLEAAMVRFHRYLREQR